MIYISQLFIYPIKSLSGIALQQASLEERGFRFDRRFMLVTSDGHCLTQHRCPQMTMLQVALDDQNGLRVWHRQKPGDMLEVPLPGPSAQHSPLLRVRVWDSQNIKAIAVSSKADHWFSSRLTVDCRLVYMPDSTYRAVDPAYARYHEALSFADGYPFLLIGQSSLDELNARLAEPLSILRFRPNIVVSGSKPYEEETWEHFKIGNITFYRGERCGRCVLTTLNPLTGQKGPEPLRTLATYRQQDHKLVFGQYVLAKPTPVAVASESTPTNYRDTIHIGQAIDVVHAKPAEHLV